MIRFLAFPAFLIAPLAIAGVSDHVVTTNSVEYVETQAQGGTFKVTVVPPDLSASWTLTWPTTGGTNHNTLHTNGSGTSTWSMVDVTNDITGAVPIANGGTGQTAKTAAFDALQPMTTAGDVVYGGVSGTGTRLAKGTSTQLLHSGTTPAWSGVDPANDLIAAVAIANGGTGQTAKTAAFDALQPMTTAGDVVYGGVSGTGTRLAKGTSTQVYHSGTTPSWSAVDLTADVTNTLPLGSGGTGQTTANAALNALLPTQTSNSGKVLSTDGTNTSWAAAASSTQTQNFVDIGNASNVRTATSTSLLGRVTAKTSTATVTISNATPGVITWTSHGLSSGDTVYLTTTGGLPTGLSASTTYYITVIDANSFKVSTTIANYLAGTFVATSSAGSGTQTATAGGFAPVAGSIINADVNASAALAYSKLSLTGSIVNTDVSNSAAIAGSKIVSATTATSGVIAASGTQILPIIADLSASAGGVIVQSGRTPSTSDTQNVYSGSYTVGATSSPTGVFTSATFGTAFFMRVGFVAMVSLRVRPTTSGAGAFSFRVANGFGYTFGSVSEAAGTCISGDGGATLQGVAITPVVSSTNLIFVGEARAALSASDDFWCTWMQAVH